MAKIFIFQCLERRKRYWSVTWEIICFKLYSITDGMAVFGVNHARDFGKPASEPLNQPRKSAEQIATLTAVDGWPPKGSQTFWTPWWHVYLDNFAAGQILGDTEELVGGELLHQLAEEAWASANVISAEKKRKKGVSQAEKLGAFISGETNTIGPSSSRLVKVIQATLWLLGRPHLSKKLLQVVAGRWIHILQFRRPGMSHFEAVWEFIGKKYFSA